LYPIVLPYVRLKHDFDAEIAVLLGKNNMLVGFYTWDSTCPKYVDLRRQDCFNSISDRIEELSDRIDSWHDQMVGKTILEFE
jgi:hypothetical protein